MDEWILREGAGLTGAEGEGPVGVVGFEPLLLRLIDEYGLVPLLTCSCAYSKTPISLLPASNAIFRAELPSISTIDESHSGCARSIRTISVCPCSAAHIKAVLPSSS